MKKIMKRLLAGVLSLAAVFTTLPVSQVQAAEKQYWTDAQEKAGYVEKVMNDAVSVLHSMRALCRWREKPPTVLTSTQIFSPATRLVRTQVPYECRPDY